MCCRYWAEASPELRPIVEEMMQSGLVERWQEKKGIKTQGEIFPTDVVPVIAPNRRGERAVFPMKWGFSGKTLLVNARSESAAVKPTFKEAWEKHRCIVPASWYFEWEHKKASDGSVRTGDKYMIQPKNVSVTWLCGLYRIEEGLPVFVVLTREPGEEIRFIHDRMPLILPEDAVDAWIRPDSRPEELLHRALTEMVFEKIKPA
ncbi:MAG: SOS response-associated peptidase family protein [Lachnospiraceae bacterium]|nr:SOS response-associated peptidase family protein [Lachnospiraceae bacterium]